MPSKMNHSKIEFLEFCNVLENIACTTKRLEIQKYFTDFLQKVIKNDKDSLIPILFLSNATVYPQFRNIELGIGDFAVQTVVSEATGLSIKAVKKEFIKSGDLGMIAMEKRVSQLFMAKQKLTCVSVYDKLKTIANTNGKTSTNSKKNLMLSLISLASPLETKYLIRLFESKLKIGLALQTILICIGNAFGEENPQAVKTAYNKCPDFENLINLIFKYKISGLEDHARIKAGTPLKPMLATPSKNLTKAFSKFDGCEFVSEYKYDGERVQIHFGSEEILKSKKFSFKESNDDIDKKCRIFSRNNEEISIKYPDIASLNLSEKSFILDGEAVAYAEGKIQPFQLLATRKKKNVSQIDVQVCVFAFDILYFDGVELLDYALKDRREILRNNFTEIPGKFQFANSNICDTLDEIDSMLKESIENSCEGLMIKSLSSLYRPSHRSNSWMKVKKDYLDNLGDSVDLVVVGAYYGKGKRTGTYGGFLLAVYNEETEKFEAICKIGTGFSDSDLANFYQKLVVTADRSSIECENSPDVFIKPEVVFEVKAASFSLSPLYPAGKQDGKGISLRFPRFIREREDKRPENATSSSQIVRMYAEEVNGADSEDEFN